HGPAARGLDRAAADLPRAAHLDDDAVRRRGDAALLRTEPRAGEDREVVALAVRQPVERERAVGTRRIGRPPAAHAEAAAPEAARDDVALRAGAVGAAHEATDRRPLRQAHGE